METSKAKGAGAVNPWGILLLLALGLLISFVDRTSLSSALADKNFVAEFALTSVERGWLNSSFFWSYGLCQLGMGWVVDRYGVKWPYTVCFTLWCLASAATGMVTTLGALILMRLLVGAAEAVVIPASYRWMGNNFRESQKGLAVGIFAMGGKFGPAIGAPIAAWIIVNHSWQLMFVATGLVGLLWLGPWLLMVKNDFPSKAELVTRRDTAASVTFGSLLASPVVWGGMINNFCYGYFTFYCMTWMPAYLVEQRGLSLEKSGLYTFFSFAGIAIVATIAGWAADRLIARGRDAVRVRKSFVVAGFIGGTTVLLGAYAPTLQQVATSRAGGISASLSGWLLHVSGSYTAPMLAIFVFLLIGAGSSVILLQRKWAPKVGAPAAQEAPPLQDALGKL